MKKRTCTVMIISIVTLASFTPLAALVHTEKLVQVFITAFLEKETFASIEPYFFTVSDIEDLLSYTRDQKNKATDERQRRDLDTLLERFGNPDKRVKFEQDITKGVEQARQRWMFMLKYPADTGEKIALDSIRIRIKFSPFKHYEIRVRGYYKHNGTRQRFSVSAEYLVLNGKVKIIKFR